MQLPMSRGGGVTPGNSWWGYAALFSKSSPYFRPKNVIFHTRFQTRPLKSIPVFRPGLQAEIMWLSLLRLERKQNSSSNPFRFRIFLCLSYSFGMETINFSSVPIVPSKPIPDSRPKWVQCMYTRFQTKTAQKPYPMVRHIPIQLI